ncbi:MAG TPA: hypothetical protein PLZ79_02115 [Burkholderiales bacterium]|nr:hypothetical protein [Betaproteobacteria bacterium]HQR52036.1 hypothetical protein [Burkholderiales bacterium]
MAADFTLAPERVAGFGAVAFDPVLARPVLLPAVRFDMCVLPIRLPAS